MGQYYYAIIWDSDAKFIRTWVQPTRYKWCGAKLTEHSYMEDNQFVAALEYLISKEGMFYKSAVVWAGDYADTKAGENLNLYSMAEDPVVSLRESTPPAKDMSRYRYVVNHSKNVYFDKTLKSPQYALHPLPILTAEGNGRGGGDYEGSSMDLVGTWARDILSVEDQIPDGYTLVTPAFVESQYADTRTNK
jgi:hypothetical protein